MSWSIGKDIPARAKLFWAHVLRRAVFDYVLYKGNSSRKTEWQSAYKYLFIENQKYDNGISFEEVCAMFGWDPDYLRRLSTKLTRADIKRMEASSFRDDFTQDVLEAFVDNAEKWKTSSFAVPFYPRMVDDFTPIPETKVVKRKLTAESAPIIQWAPLA